MEKTTREVTICEEAENLKDILWYIQGLNEQSTKDCTVPLFDEKHIQSLQVAIHYLITK